MKSTSKSKSKSTVANTAILEQSALLSMPEKEYMNPQQIAFFAQLLRDMQKRLLAATSLEGRLIGDNEKASDPADRATAEEGRSNEQLVRATELRQLSDVTLSLSKIVSGEYGYCDETGDPIGIPRLLARPTANLTVEEQSRKEKKLARLCG